MSQGPAMIDTQEPLSERLRDYCKDFDDDVAYVLSSESGERADLWDQIEVPISDVREAADDLDAKDARIASQAKLLEEAREVLRGVISVRDKASIDAARALLPQSGVSRCP